MSELMGERTFVRRLAHKQVTDRAVLYALLDMALMAHVGIVDDDGQPFVIPMAMARNGDRLLLHGSTASRLMSRLAEGTPACVTVTILDGISVARSAIETSMQYRSAIVLGRATPITDPVEKLDALARLTEALLPGRWADARPPLPAELARVLVVALPLDEWSVKVSRAVPEDQPSDLDLPVWAGVVPVLHRFGEPVPSADLIWDIPVPQYVMQWPDGRT
jgi:nitroimidazol reductase NimA-like FMN-containing flavoprotein (pyridoxamine 5'-phosphate oxidase superfamily)